MMYAVSVQVTTHDGDYSGSKSVPTFYLDSRVQGITSAEHAAEVARDVVNPLGAIPAGDLDIRAYQVDPVRAGMLSVAERQTAILRAEPYLAGEAVLMRALTQEHDDMCAWVPGHSARCAHWSEHVNA